MEIIVGKTAGFCFGVTNAVNKTEEALRKYDNVSCLGELVHNRKVIDKLEENGLTTISEISQAKQKVIIRAHGEKLETYEAAKNLDIDIIDLTCPKVTKIHKIATEYKNKNYYIFVIGNSNHPETIGTISYCGKNSYIIESEDDVEQALKQFDLSKANKLLVLVQTTFSLEKFNKITDLINKNVIERQITEFEIKRTICDATRLRQEETLNISSNVDMMIIIGGTNSSNTLKLYEISKKNCKSSVLIQNSNELNIDDIKTHKKVGIMAGASTPKESIETVVELLKKL